MPPNRTARTFDFRKSSEYVEDRLLPDRAVPPKEDSNFLHHHRCQRAGAARPDDTANLDGINRACGREDRALTLPVNCPLRSDKIGIMKSKSVGCLLILSVALSVRPVLLFGAAWVNATGNLANMASECGSLTLLSAVPGSETVIAGVAQKGLWANSAGTSWSHLGSGAGSDKTTDSASTFHGLGSLFHHDYASVDFTDPNRQTLLARCHEQAQTVYRSTNSGQAPSPAPPTNVRILSGPPDGATIFFDDFLGTSIDSAKWTVFDRLSDQVNNEVNCVIPRNVSVSGGILAGVSKFEDHVCGDSVEAPKTMHYTSWQIQQATAPFRYGTVEVRAKAPGGTGLWPAVWMLGFEWQASQPFTANTPGHQWPKAGWSEIDIAEFWQGGRTQVNTTVHYETAGGLHIQALPFNATTRFMVYRLQWTAGSLIWSVDAEDGVGFRTLYTVTGASSVPNVPMYVVLHTAIGGTGGGTPDPSTFPQTFQVDYVRITQ